MDESAEKAAIMAVLKAETAAWLRRDFAAQAEHWVQGPEARLMTAFRSIGARVIDGWDAIAARLGSYVEHAPQTYGLERVRWERVNVVVGADMAWVSYDQIGTDLGDGLEIAGLQHGLKIFHRIDGVWKIACLVLMQRSAEHAGCPLVEVDPQARVLWTNPQARERLRNHPGLVVAAGRLRARRRERDADLRAAIAWAFARLRDEMPPAPVAVARLSRAIPLGEDDAAAPLFCWVVIEDARALVTFDDAAMTARRIDAAAAVYGLTPPRRGSPA